MNNTIIYLKIQNLFKANRLGDRIYMNRRNKKEPQTQSCKNSHKKAGENVHFLRPSYINY